MNLRVQRLRTGDVDHAQRLFALLASVFDEARPDLGDAYVRRRLSDESFWVLAAFSRDEIIGGITAHTLPMTRSESSEIFVYDVAVHADHQRRGVGRALFEELRAQAAVVGVRDLFVAADDEDAHALDFYRALGGISARVTMFTFG